MFKLAKVLVGFTKLAKASNKAAHDKGLPDIFIHLHDWNEEYRITPEPKIGYNFPFKVKVTLFYLHLKSNTEVKVEI